MNAGGSGAAWLRVGSIPVWVLPVLHYRVEYAQLVVEACRELEPDAIAVELPQAMQTSVLTAVDRLPFLSILRFAPEGAARPALEDAGADAPTGYLLVEPADPIVEALRQARERRISAQCIDANLFEYPDRHDRLPDPYAAMRIGHRAYYDEVVRARFADESPDAFDSYREAVMAANVAELVRAGATNVLVVCGIAHAARLVERLESGSASRFGIAAPEGAIAIDRASVQCFNLHEDASREVLAEWPYLSATYERARRGDGDDDAPTELRSPRIISFASRRRLEAEILESFAPPPARLELPIDRQTVAWYLFREASARYEQDTGDRVSPHQLRVLMKFLRNWSLVRGRLQPDLAQLVESAKGSVDDNYAYEAWDIATFWPWQDASGALPTLRPSIEDLYGGMQTIHFHRREKTRRKRPVLMRSRRGEKRPGEWAEGFDGSAICSYPPEDVIIENFGGFLKKKAKSVLSEENSRVEPFTTSILDGIDVRETIRNWHKGQIFVRDNQRSRGEVGSVVVIFDEDRDADAYPWLMTWLGEHEQESDMALYSTDPVETIVGPGISRAEYGGFMMTYPPRRVADVWDDPFYREARTKAEVLLMAAIDYSLERLVVYVASDPPRTALKTFAARYGKKIVYVPSGVLSPVTVKKLRVFHVLSGYDKRAIASDYIW